MSEANPKKAMAALIPEPIRTTCGIDVHPLTLGVYALLERIGSPVLVKCKAEILDLLPSLWIMTLPEPKIALRHLDEIEEMAVAWADTLPPDAIGEIEAAATEQVARMLDVIAPEGDGKKKATTGGSRPSSGGRARRSGGIWKRFFGRFRRRRSS